MLANDIYHQLTQEGFKVFYAAITLEDKLGQEYEPYIFAALNSAKVMLVIGSKPEYFTAVWVKNEWSRYLKLMKADRSKLLIPCYKDMDAYELPEEFAHLQAQDMGKIGFINDIVRGIKKVINKDEPKSAVKETAAAGQAANSAVAPLLKRISLFLEDGNWQEADEYCERVLDSDPENAQAYLYKLMAKMEVRKTEDLRNQAQPFDSEDMYRKIVRFADEEFKNTLVEYNAYIKDRNEKKRIESIYKKAVYDMRYARDEISYKIIIEDLAEIPGYKDADEKKKECEEKAEECRLESLYNSAVKNQTVQSEDNQFRAAKQFEELGTYKDSAERVQQCRDKAEEIRKEEERIKAEREKAEKERKAKAKKRNRNIAIILPSTTAICVVLALLCVYVIIPAIAPVGSLIKYGKYEQDNDSSNGIEDIEWIILAKDDNKMLVISDKAIDCKPYNTSSANITWETCSLRNWLNNDFINSAFSATEKTMISSVKVSADKNPDYDTDAGNDTEDKVFLLSIEEANRYFKYDSERQCVSTEYAKANGAYTYEIDGASNCFWWLRSQGGYSNKSASVVNSDGTVSKYGNAVDDNRDCVRPAMWISLA